MSYYSIEIARQAAMSSLQNQGGSSLFAPITGAVDPRSLVADRNDDQNNSSPSYEQVMQMIDRSISQMKVYVVESEITDSQLSIKTVVEQASF